MLKPTLAVAAAVALLAGCGGGDDDGGSEPLSAEGQAFSRQITAIDKRVQDQFGKLAGTGQNVKPSEPVPADVKREGTALVDIQREAAGDIEKLEAPTEIADATDKYVAGLRKQADAIEKALKSKKTTMEKLGAALLGNQPPKDDLILGGYLPPPAGG